MMNPPYAQLGEMLRRERKRRDLTQREAGDRFGITQPSYHRWESGTAAPESRRFGEIADFLGIDVGEVWALCSPEHPEPTSLTQMRERVRGLERDVTDLRTEIRLLKQLLLGDPGSEQAY